MCSITGGSSASRADCIILEFFADKIPYVDSVWDVIHTFVRIPGRSDRRLRCDEPARPEHLRFRVPRSAADSRTAAHGSKAAIASAPISHPTGNELDLSFVEDGIAIVGVLLAVFAPVVIMSVLAIFVLLLSTLHQKYSAPSDDCFVPSPVGSEAESFAEVAKRAG